MGKARSACNGVQHGLYTRAMVIASGPLAEDSGEVRAFAEAVRADLRPVGAVEELLTDRVASLLWRVGRVPRAEAAAVEALTLRKDGPGEVVDLIEEPPWSREHPERPPEITDMLVAHPTLPAYRRAVRTWRTFLAADVIAAVARAEAHLSRELARTLALLDAMQRRRAGP